MKTLDSSHSPFSAISPTISALDSGLVLTGRFCALATALTPLIVNFTAYDDSYFGPKWAWIAILALTGFAAALGRAALGRPLRFPVHAMWIAPLIFFALNLVSVAWAPSRSLALERAAWVGSLTLMLWVMNEFAPTRKWLVRIAWAWIASSVITALWTLWQDFAAAFWPELVGLKPNLPDWRGYLAAGLGNTNHIGDLLALALLPTLVLLGTARRRWAIVAAVASAVILAAGLTVSYSVGSNLGLGIGALVMLAIAVIKEGWRFFRYWRRWVLLLGLWAGMIAFFTLDHPANPHRPGILKQGFSSERWKEGGPTRVVIWAGALEIIRERPWLGAGAGNFTYLFPETHSELVARDPDLRVYLGAWTNAVHNEILQAWAELGVGGMFVWAAIFALAFHQILPGVRWRPRLEYIQRMTLAGLLAAWAAQSMMNFTFQTPVGALSLYVLLWAVWVESHTRADAPADQVMVSNYGPIRVTFRVRELSRVKSFGLSLNLPAAPAAVLSVIPLILVLAMAAPWLNRPARAQTEYAKARALGAPPEAERHLKRALDLDPRATGARSYYSNWLIQRGRPDDGLKQLKIVRERLNSSELYEREARAWMQKGNREKTERAIQMHNRRYGLD